MSASHEPMLLRKRGLCAAALLAAALLLGACEQSQSDQRGPRGSSQIQLKKPSAVAALADINKIPAAEEPADIESPPTSEVFVNVKVLNDISATEFSRLMQAFSTWVAPEEGCEFCHNTDKMESDEKYPKIVARRMIEMTRKLNTDWKKHVGETGVTCWTCHRGQQVPSGDWFNAKGPMEAIPLLGYRSGQNAPAANAAGSSLPGDPLSLYLTTGLNEIRVQSTTALPTRHEPPGIKTTEWTYSLMLYMAGSLGVNCTYCHNTRAMARWDESTPQRVTAWHGIRMVREINTDFLTPLTPVFPPNRLGPHGDGPKVGCATCHKGTFKPLNGISPLTDYLALSGVGKVPAGTPTPPEAPAEPPAPAAPKAPAGQKVSAALIVPKR
jgi:photosynthetic reaction center cytochrome c subunit